ncbi:hypothetical protein [Campylobacter gastrosuis]|uniref:Lipoprotein n=1 Tax=Campylobacter gastrosuis TaxID=2974576 RepID=A0ABT7HQL0_9BACT|nr:hypothetical protein [Campylobacter gastrosuis]MDL0089140.1 hypothetical protein [Campylobacter gastrosuis]
MRLTSGLRFGLLACLAYAFGGCALNGVNFVDFEVPNYDESLLYLYSPNGNVVIRVEGKIGPNDDKKQIIWRNGEFLKIRLRANNKYIYWAKTETTSSVVIDAKSGEIICVKLTGGVGFRAFRPYLQIVDLATCKNEIRKTQNSPQQEFFNHLVDEDSLFE